MSTNRRPTPFTQFGGLRLDLPLDEIGGSSAYIIEDIEWNQSSGAIVQRPGAKQLTGTPGSAVYSVLFRHQNATLLAVRNSATKKLVAIDGTSGLEFKEISWPAEQHVSLVRMSTPAGGYSYAFTDLVAPIKFDGTNFTTPTCTVDGVAGKAMPKTRNACTWPDGGYRLVIAGTNNSGGGINGPGGAVSTESHVWFSEPGNAEGWESTAYVQVSPGDGERITGCASWGGLIFVFKETRMFVFYAVATDEEGRPEFKFRTVDLGTKMIDTLNNNLAGVPQNNHNCVAGDGGLYYLTEDGVYLTRGGEPSLVSTALTPLANNSYLGGTLLLSEQPIWSKCRDITWFRHRLFITCRNAGSYHLLVFNTMTGMWSTWRAALNSIAVFEPSLSVPFLGFAGDGTTGNNIYYYNPALTTDPSKAIAPVWQSGFYDLGTRDEKTLVESKLWGRGKVTLSAYSDLDLVNADFTDTLEMPATNGLGQARSHKSQPAATFFSHRVTLEPGAELLSIDRYLREGRTATTKTT